MDGDIDALVEHVDELRADVKLDSQVRMLRQEIRKPRENLRAANVNIVCTRMVPRTDVGRDSATESASAIASMTPARCA